MTYPTHNKCNSKQMVLQENLDWNRLFCYVFLILFSVFAFIDLSRILGLPLYSYEHNEVECNNIKSKSSCYVNTT